MLEEVALAGTAWVNVRPETLLTLSLEVAGPDLLESGVGYADQLRTRLLVADLLAQVPEVRRYLPTPDPSPGTVRAFHAAIRQLRAHRVQAEHFPTDAFLDVRRGTALAALLRSYEQRLAALRLVDETDVFRLACAKPIGDLRLLVPGSLLVEDLWAQELLRSVPPGAVSLLSDGTPGGVALPAHAAASLLRSSTRAQGNGPYAAILTPASSAPDLELFAAKDPAQEVGAVLRQSIASGWRLDSMQILLAKRDPYAAAIREATARAELPVTFSFGLPISITRPGRAAVAYIRWWSEGLPARLLADAFAGGVLELPRNAFPEGPKPHRVAHLLRRANVGWGRDRYLPGLRSLAASLPGGQEQRRGEIEAIAAGLASILHGLPAAEDRRCHVSDLASSLRDFLAVFAIVRDDLDAEAKASLLETLDVLTTWPAQSPRSGHAAEELLRELDDMRVGACAPKPGHIHCALLRDGRPAGREHTAILGLDESSWPSPAVDPLLLESERQAMVPPLPSPSELASQELYLQVRSFAQIGGTLTCSYSLKEGGASRRAFPSPLMLQAYRLKTGDFAASYSDLERHLASEESQARPSPSFGADAAWLRRILRGPIPLGAREALARALPHLTRGEGLLSARRSSEVTPYDGQIDPDPENLDPRRSGVVLSATRLETLGACPLAYFFRYVLGVEPPDELDLDPGHWLDAKERGGLLHAVFQDFYARIGRRTEGAQEDEALLMDVVETRLMDWRARIPPPSDAVFDRERTEIGHAAQAFLEMESRDTLGASPAFFEVTFGMDAPQQSPLDTADPVELSLPDGSVLRLRGRIDRIDDAGDHRYHIWDYKTGRAYKDGGTLLRGRRVQHALYQVAARDLLRRAGVDESAAISLSGYRFPTRRGRLRRWLPEGRDAADQLGGLLANLLDLVAAGTFLAAEDGEHCGICDFRAACGGKVAAEATQAKLASETDALRLLKEVASVE